MRLLTLSVFSFFLLAVFVAAFQTVSYLSAAPVRADSIRVMSYNIHHANPPSLPDSIDLEAIGRVIRKQKPDIVALQEVDVNTGRSGYDEARELAEKTGLTPYFAKAIDYDGGAYGVAILSRFPIQEKKQYALPSNPETHGEPRILATATIRLSQGQLITFACTHLDAQKSPENRHMQIREITRLLKDDPYPIILAGDLNDTIGSETIQVLDQHFTRTCEDCAPTIPAVHPVKTIDFIAFKPAKAFSVVKQQVIAETYASDHAPVFAILKFTP